MNIERWWKHAVMYDVSVAGAGDQTNGSDVGLHMVISHMDDLQALGVDAIVLRDLSTMSPTMNRTQLGDVTAPRAHQQGEMFDDLIQQASRRRLRVLIELQPETPADLTTKARFWLNRGVAGFYLSTARVSSAPGAIDATAPVPRDEVLALRSVLKAYAGERILVSEVADVPAVPAASSDVDVARPLAGRGRRGSRSTVVPSSSPHGGSSDQEMVIVWVADIALPGVGAHKMRSSLEQATETIQRINASRATPLLATAGQGTEQPSIDASAGNASFGKAEATVLLGIGVPAMIEARGLTLPDTAPVSSDLVDATGVAQTSQTAGRNGSTANAAKESAAREASEMAERHSLYEWYRQLNALAHGNPTLRSGATILLNRDSDRALVWVRTPRAAGPIVVLACNLSDQPTTFSLVEDVQRLHLRGSFLRTMLRSDDAMGAMPLRAVVLPPHGVYIGELSR